MDGQSYLLLIRDEGGPPELQVGRPAPPPPSLPLSLAQGGPHRLWLLERPDQCRLGPETPPPPCPAPFQFAAWVDAVVFVFSLEDEISFQTVYNYYLRLCSYRNTSEVPMVLVGTQGGQGRLPGLGGGSKDLFPQEGREGDRLLSWSWGCGAPRPLLECRLSL